MRVTYTVEWKVLSAGFCFKAATAMGCSRGRITCELDCRPDSGREQISNRRESQGQKRPPPWIRNGIASISGWSSISVYGAGRGPACVLERLPETLARIVSCCLSSEREKISFNQISKKTGNRI